MPKAHLYGTPVSPGIALGRIHFLHGEEKIEKRQIREDDVEREQGLLKAAAATVADNLRGTLEKVPADLKDYREVIEAQIELSEDPKLLESASRRIKKEHVCPAWAMAQTVEQLCEAFRQMDDPYMRDRAQDIRTVGLRICALLSGRAPNKSQPLEDAILAAEDISPADVMDLDLKNVRGIVTREGGITSHTAILARGLHIPALVSVTGMSANAKEGDPVILDGLGGNLLVVPDEKDSKRFDARRLGFIKWESSGKHMAHWPADTSDGVKVQVYANVDRTEEAEDLFNFGADGIGLYRTEFTFLKKRRPTEEELLEEYSAIIRCSPGGTVIRTLDAGADKLLPSQQALKEPNPALGLRGVRFTLCHQEVFRLQLRALLRAGVNGPLSILLPLITQVEEVRAVRRILQEVEQELSSRNLPYKSGVPLGVMVETPAAVLIADALAKECDFFSIGTNDLIHYLLSIDRNNRHVAYLSEAMHPAVIRSLKRIIDCGHREGIRVSACGELSSDPFGVVLMLGMGLDAFSASPAFLPSIKQLIRKLDSKACNKLAGQVLMSTDIPACKHMVSEMLQKVLGKELSFHTSGVMDLSTLCAPTQEL